MARNSAAGLNSIFLPHTKVVLFIIFLHIIGALAQVMAVSILRPLLQEGVYGGDLSDIMELGMLLIVLTGIASVILAVTSYLASKVASAISSSLRMQIMEAALEAEDAGSIGNNTTVTMTCLTNDVAAIERYAFETLRTYLPMPFLFVFIIAFTSWINVTIGVIMMTILIVVGIVTYLFSKRLFPLFGQQIESMDDVNALFRQKISGARTIRAYNGYEYEKSKFSVVSDKFGKLNTKIAMNSYYIPNLSTAIMWMFIVFVFIDSALEGMGAIVPADIIVFMQFATYLVASLSIIPYFSIQSPRASACFGRIRQIVDAAQEFREAGGPSPDTGDWSGPIFEVEDVTYVDSHGRTSVDGVDISVDRGQTVTIVGMNGSGASDLVQMALGFSKPTSGKVSIAGSDVFHTDVRVIRDKVSYAGNAIHVFRGTMRYNLDPLGDHTDEELLDICGRIGLNRLIDNMPDGLDTVVSDDNSMMSGGQRLLVILVRCLLRDSELYIFDDCFFSLDRETRVKAMEVIRERCAGRTVIFVMHDVSTCAVSDEVVLMDRGKVLDLGTHEELLERSDLYNSICSVGQGRKGSWA